jgi:hypothetical protein
MTLSKIYAPGTLRDFAVAFANRIQVQTNQTVCIIKTPTCKILKDYADQISLRYVNDKYVLEDKEQIVAYSYALLISTTPHNNRDVINIKISSDFLQAEKIICDKLESHLPKPVYQFSTKTYSELIYEMLTDPDPTVAYVVDFHVWDTSAKLRSNKFNIIGDTRLNVVARNLPQSIIIPNNQIYGYRNTSQGAKILVDNIFIKIIYIFRCKNANMNKH